MSKVHTHGILWSPHRHLKYGVMSYRAGVPGSGFPCAILHSAIRCSAYRGVPQPLEGVAGRP